ncbi:MAG: hypothetical protein ACRENF_06520 [Thermodesulfobacteriota bacterium]
MAVRFLNHWGFMKMWEQKLSWSLFITGVFALYTLAALFIVIPNMQRESAEAINTIEEDTFRLSSLNSSVLTQAEVELNSRLLDSEIKHLFHKANIKGDKINVILDQSGWKDLSLNERANLILQVASICRSIVENSAGFEPGFKISKPEIHFYDRTANKELAFWSDGSGIILN